MCYKEDKIMLRPDTERFVEDSYEIHEKILYRRRKTA